MKFKVGSIHRNVFKDRVPIKPKDMTSEQGIMRAVKKLSSNSTKKAK